MDKNLKKLSRVELLEIMIGLSEECERLAAENARLKKTINSRRLPRSAKVGSIAEAALSANGYFEAAQRSADDYLREIKRLRDELAVRVNEAREASSRIDPHVEERAQALLRDARARASQIVAQANEQAASTLAEASAQVAAASTVRASQSQSGVAEDGLVAQTGQASRTSLGEQATRPEPGGQSAHSSRAPQRSHAASLALPNIASDTTVPIVFGRQAPIATAQDAQRQGHASESGAAAGGDAL